MKKLIGFTMKNTLVVFLLVVMLIGGGLYSASKINVETMPDITIPIITTVTVYPGASPEDVTKDITETMQKSISGIQGVTDVKTVNDDNVGIVVAEFNYQTNMDDAEKNINSAVGKISLPKNAETPTTSRVSLKSSPVITYAVESKESPDKLADTINNKVTPKLSGVSGVSSVGVQGLPGNNVYVELDPQKLSDNGLTMSEVQSAVTGNNVSSPLGQVKIGGKTLTVNVDNAISSADELKAIPIVVPVNTTSVISDGINQLGQGLGQMSKGLTSLAQSESQIGAMVAGNTQAIGYLDAIQQLQMGVLAQQAVLTNPESTPTELSQANATLAKIQQSLTDSQAALNKVLSGQEANGEALQSEATSGQTSSKSSSTSSNSLFSGGSINIKVVFLGDLGNITTTSSQDQLITRTNLKNCVVLSVYKSVDANTVQVSAEVKSAISDLAKNNPSIKFSLINDNSKDIEASVSGMVRDGILGALFAIIIIMLFLRDVRATVIAVVSIPLSVLIALLIMPRLGITLNIMSLGGIAVAIGRIVDDSIVIIENIYRRFGISATRDDELIKDAAAEVGSAVMSSTITTIGVFLPMLFINGIIGKIFFQFAVTVVICIVASLLVAIIVVPLLSKKMLLNKKIKQKQEKGRVIAGYRKLLLAALNHKVIVMSVSVAIFAVTMFFAKGIPTQFLPSESSSVVTASLTMAPGTSESVTDSYALKFEKQLMDRSDIATVSSSVGDNSNNSGGSVMSIQGSNQASFNIVIKNGRDYDKVADEISSEAAKLSDKNATFTASPQSLSGQSDNVEVDVYGNSADDIEKAADLISDKLKGNSELSDVVNSVTQKKPEIELDVDAKKAADNGLTPQEVSLLVASNLNSSLVTTMKNTSGGDISVYLGYKDQNLDSVSKINDLSITGANGSVKLSEIAKVTQSSVPQSITEFDGKQYASVTANIKSKDTSSVSSDVMKSIDQMKSQFPKGVTYSQGGSEVQLQDSFSQMGVAMLVAILLVYILMLLTFGDGKTPFAILLSLPFAAVGAILALVITGQSLSVSGLIGLLMLIGIVVTNAIVLLDRVKHNRERGMTVKEALVEAGGVRLRPIIMTACATVTALMPLALGSSEGAIISQGLGIVVIGGLVVSTVITLIVVPVFYSILHRDRVL